MNYKGIKRLTVIGCFLLSLCFSQPVSAIIHSAESQSYQSDNKQFTHKVSKGETLYSIAKQYNIQIEDIYMLNPKAEKGIKDGDKLIISRLSVSVPQGTSEYKVAAKETLYSISKKFDISINELIAQNPELKLKPLAEGQILQISKTGLLVSVPNQVSYNSQFIEHVVQPKETIYGISKQYGITTESLTDFNPVLQEGLKQGTTLVIPVIQVGNQPLLAQNGGVSTLTDFNSIKIGLVLPFVSKAEGQTARFIEYYEGFLLALAEAKSKGLSANVYVFDMGTEAGTSKLTSLLDTYEMKNLDLLIGGISQEQISIMSDFARKQGVKYLIPFPTKTDETQNNPYVYQLNAPYSMSLYNNVAKVFSNTFPGSNVIIITDDDNKKDFVSALTAELTRRGITPKFVTSGSSLASNLALSLDKVRKNVIVPASGNINMIQELFPALHTIVTEQPELSISLFGHPEWQSANYQQYASNFAKYDTYIYSQLNFSPSDSKVKQFINQYSGWYNNKTLINTFPRYGLLGYDAGNYILSAINNYGRDFEDRLSSFIYPTLQSSIILKKSNYNSGYINNGFYLIHYNPDMTIEKTEYGR